VSLIDQDSNGSASALSDSLKEAVKSWVPKVRKILDDEFAAQLGRLGIRRNGGHVALDKMTLPPLSVSVRRRVEALVAHESLSEGTPERGYDNVIRELTYTLLNRLVGLKAMEARKLLYLHPPNDETASAEETEVITPVVGQARSRYLRDFRAVGGSRYKYEDDAEEALLRDGLTAAFRQVTKEIRVLFDPDHEYACVWPTHAALADVLQLINEGLPADAYRAQDFLGWVYQFFNRAEKERVRFETKGTPRSSYELAVINQFYTPSWVVKALVDNTLGRLWLQMHPDSGLQPKLPPPLPGQQASDAPVADYLVPRTGERIRYQRVTDDGQVAAFKRAIDITLIDPACGTMHFGQYAFGLFYRMYIDEIENAGNPGWPTEPSVVDLRAIPAAILEHNLFGIDIDPRAIQIASLSLLLTAKEAALRHGFSPVDVQVRRSNLVVANAVDLGEDGLRQLVERVGAKLGSEALRHRLLKTLWDNLQYVGELGSLIQVREGVAQVLKEWVDARAKDKGLTKPIGRKTGAQMELGSILTEDARAIATQHERERKVLEHEATQLQQELLVAIEEAASQSVVDTAERLFAEDTARGLKLLQMLARRYDIAVMNPPYGSFVPKVKDFVKAAYPLTSNDIYASFIDRGTQLTEREGYVGALVSATFVNLITFEKLRTEILLKRNPLVMMLDLGFGILDGATVEAAALVIHGGVR
jgi:Eco57I restriction-modification methylase